MALLACPVCEAGLSALPDDAGLRCASGHAFDRARQGHVTLQPPVHRRVPGDSAPMVADRTFYERLSGGQDRQIRDERLDCGQ